MSRSAITSPATRPDNAIPADEHEELPDVPLTPREGWVSVIALMVMLGTLGVALDDARWTGNVAGTSMSQTGFLPLAAILAVIVGTLLAKSRMHRYGMHVAGAVLGAIFLLNVVAASISTSPGTVERLQQLNLSVGTWVREVVVIGTRSYETSVFLIVLGALVWGAGQFSAYAVFRRHRPLPAVLLTGFMLLINVSITIRDEYLHLIVFAAAALVLLMRLNLLDQTREWRMRGMRDVADISQAFMRNGAAFVAVAIVGATVLAANGSSAPLSRAWRNVDEQLLEVGYAVNRLLGGVSGATRGPNILFTPSQTIRGVWESSSEPVFRAVTDDDDPHRWRGATYDSFDGNTWQQLDRQVQIVETGDSLLAGTAEQVDKAQTRRHSVTVTIHPADYGGDVIVAPEVPEALEQRAEVVVSGQDGPFVAAKLVDGIDSEQPYTVTSLVRSTRGAAALTGNELAAAGTNYPDWVHRYLAIRPGSLGDVAQRTARELLASLPVDQRDPYHIAVAVQDYLYRTGGFSYTTDVRGRCEDNSKLVDCFIEIKEGYCEYFATTMTMLLREMGVPARYVLGYLPGRQQDDGSWLVDRSAAHAWVEVYFPGQGWVAFDPTPGNSENGQEPTVLAAGPDRGPAPSAAPFPGRGEIECDGPDPADCEDEPDALPDDSAVVIPPGAPTDYGPGGLLAVIVIIATLLILAAIAAVRRVPSTEPELAYLGITKLAQRLGYGPRPAQTAYEFAAGLGQLVPVAQDDLRLIATAKVEATYGRRAPGDSLRRHLALAYRRVRIGLLRLVIRRPRFGLRPRGPRPGPRDSS